MSLVCERWGLTGVAIHLSLRHTAVAVSKQRHAFNLPLQRCFHRHMPVIAIACTVVFIHTVWLYGKNQGVPQGSVLFPFSFSPSSPSLVSLIFRSPRCPRTNRWSKVMSPAHQRCRPAWWQTSPPGASLTKHTPAIRRWFNMAISLNVTQHWLRARPTIQPH